MVPPVGGEKKKDKEKSPTCPALPTPPRNIADFFVYLPEFLYTQKQIRIHVVFPLYTLSLACCTYSSASCFLLFKNYQRSLGFPNQYMKAENSISLSLSLRAP